MMTTQTHLYLVEIRNADGTWREGRYYRVASAEDAIRMHARDFNREPHTLRATRRDEDEDKLKRESAYC